MLTAPTTQREGFAPHKRVVIGLAVCLLATAVFMLANLSGNLGFVFELRGRKLAAMVLVGWATGVATVAFQTVTNNRLLTPSIMGLDALYIFIQSVLVLVLGISLVGQVGAYPMFFLNVGLMLLAASALTGLLFGKRSRSVYVVVLAGLVLGAVLRSLSSLIARVLDPSSFMVLQDNLFASFTAVNPQLIWLCAVIVALASWYLWSMRHTLDVLTLGKDAAVSLGVPYQRTVRRVLLVATLLVCVSTALVGPITFLGLIVAAVAYQISGTGRHAVVMPMAGLLGVAVLVGGQAVLEQVLGQATVLSVVIEFVGGIAFIWLVIR
ncbi:MAG: iron chelate uptake ABC transporter family permease subunit, partial [Propionibacteriaceae bacterium]|nr:iron chelate uptake ABC transporter family permease subunit [Propionibacteriaceae bacterium]